MAKDCGGHHSVAVIHLLFSFNNLVLLEMAWANLDISGSDSMFFVCYVKSRPLYITV